MEAQKPFVKEFFTASLSHFSYFIEYNKVAVVIDPIRAVDQYVKLASERQATLKFVLMTHTHCEFVTGHLDLQFKGAEILNNASHPLADQQEIILGDQVKLIALSTPGHTQDSMSFILTNEQGKPQALFTGYSLFLAEYGKPELAILGTDLKVLEENAALQHESLVKLAGLDKTLTVYPGKRPVGEVNSAPLDKVLKDLNLVALLEKKEEFIKAVVESIKTLKVPPYQVEIVKKNQITWEPLESLKSHKFKSITLQTLKELMEKGVKVIDLRDAGSFLKHFGVGTYSFQIGMPFEMVFGKQFKQSDRFAIIAPQGQEEMAFNKLMGIEFLNFEGYLEGGFDTWKNGNMPCYSLYNMPAEEFKSIYESGEKIVVIDVRNPPELKQGFLTGSKNIPLSMLEDQVKKDEKLIPKDETIYTFCRTGGRACSGASILTKLGYRKIVNLAGGLLRYK